MTQKLMGSIFELIIIVKDEASANHHLTEGVTKIKHIEDELSEFKDHSATHLINKNAGIKSIKVSDDVFSIIKRSNQISELTQGAFDISVGPLKKIYNFKNEEFKFPSAEKIKEALDLVGFNHIFTDELKKEVYLSKSNMHISFAAIGKGYAADCVKKLWQNSGITSGVISASGDLTTFGVRHDGSPWQVGIADPDSKDGILFFIPLTNASIATSGDAEQFFVNNGIRYSHNINPITGKPISGIKSVSVIGRTAELADALATAVYVMGKDVGIHFINQLPETHCIIIDDLNRTHCSKNISIQHEA